MNGKMVLLKADGTWVYLGEQSPVVAPSSAAKSEAIPSKEQLTSPPAKQEPKTEIDSGEKTATRKTIYEGPRDRHSHYSKSGKKVYERKK